MPGRIEPGERTLLRQIANPLLVGEMPHDGTHFVISHHWNEPFNRCRSGDPGDTTVEKLRRLINEPQETRLSREAKNLIILVYAAQIGMSFSLHGGHCEGTIANLDDAWTLTQEAAPDKDGWERAVQRAGSLFGVAASPLATAASAAALGTCEERGLTPDAAGARIEEIRRAHPLARIQVAITWTEGG